MLIGASGYGDDEPFDSGSVVCRHVGSVCSHPRLDGYLQAFASPGMVKKINAAWFAHRERGRFSGIFGSSSILAASVSLILARTAGWVTILG